MLLSTILGCCSQLVALLREVKYLNQREPNPDQPIPESTAAVFSQNETYRKYLQNLDVTVALYNKVKETILDVEEPLIEEQLQKIDAQLERAISELNWTSEGTTGGGKSPLHPSLIMKF